ncbi:MAG: hypothetical protein WCY37_04305 [Candidatus Dojkabacteria bacterium]
MIRLHGEYEFWQGSRLVYRFSNIVCTPVYYAVLKGLTGEVVPDIDVTYFAFGTGTGAVAEGDTTLGTEVFRKQVTSKGWNGKQFVAICQLANNEANYSLKEVGVFAGGTVTADSGTLLSHALKDIEKNSNITYNVIYRLNLEEV